MSGQNGTTSTQIKIVTRADILSKRLKTNTVIVEDWGGAAALVREMSGKEREMFERVSTERISSQKSGLDTRGLRQMVVQTCFIDEDGQPVFSGSKEDGEQMMNMSGRILDLLFDEILRLSGLMDAEKKPEEEELKNDLSVTSLIS